MTLPASRRPRYAEEILLQETEKLQTEKLKVKISKSQCVLDAFAQWYSCLTVKEKQRLNRKRLKRRIVSLCYNVKMPYDHMPDDWLQMLIEKHNIVLIEKQKKTTNNRQEKVNGRMEYEFDDDDPLSSEDEHLGEDIIDGIDTDGLKLENLISGSLEERLDEPPPVRELRSTKRKIKVEKVSVCSSDSEECTSIQKRKRWIDLTNEPPPDFWLEAAANSISLPRTLRYFSAPDVNITFYDYDSDCTKVPAEVINLPIEYTGFDWWSSKG